MSAPIIDSLPLPPHSPEAEHALLGVLLANPESFHLIEPPLEPGDFYNYANRLIYQAIFSLASQGKPADVLTVSDLLREIGNEKETGGLEYLNRLTESYASAANLSEYARIVKDKALKRNLISKLAQLEAEVNSDRGASSEDLLDRVQSEFLKMGLGKNKDASSFESSGSILDGLIDEMRSIADSPTEIRGCESGIEQLDDVTRGFRPGQLVVIAARPGIGKTAFALQVARRTAVRQKKPVAIFALEMTKNEVLKRMLSSESEVEMESIDGAQMTDTQWSRIYQAQEVLSKAPIFVDSSSELTLMRIKTKLRQLAAQVGTIGLVVVDYLQLLEQEDENASADLRSIQIGVLSRGLKLLAKELNAPVLLLSQLNRQVENRPNHTPLLSDLRESGSIEQDADMVLLLYSKAKFGQEQGDSRTIYMDLAKHRNGRLEVFSTIFKGEIQCFEELNAWNQ